MEQRLKYISIFTNHHPIRPFHEVITLPLFSLCYSNLYDSVVLMGSWRRLCVEGMVKLPIGQYQYLKQNILRLASPLSFCSFIRPRASCIRYVSNRT